MARIALCASCATEKKIVARGLCWSCYGRHRNRGTLEDFSLRTGADALPRRPLNGCLDCGVATTKRDGVCRACTRVRRGAEDEVALTGGQWVLDRRARVMRWVS